MFSGGQILSAFFFSNILKRKYGFLLLDKYPRGTEVGKFFALFLHIAGLTS